MFHRPLIVFVLLLLTLGCSGESGSSAPGAVIGAPPTLPAKGAPHDLGLTNLVAARVTAVEAALENAEAWGALGVAFDAHDGIDGDFGDEALRCYAAAADLEGSSFRWPYLAATIVYKSDQGAAIQWLDRALGADPAAAGKYGPLFLRRGIGQLALGELALAKADYLKAVELDPGLVLGWLGLASVALAEDDPDAALEFLGRAQGAGPETDEIHGLYAEAYRRLGRADEAAASLARMEDGGRREPIPDRLRGEVASKGISLTWARSRVRTLLELDRADEAVVTWNNVIQRADTLDAQFDLADLYITLGRTEDAEAVHSKIESRVSGPEATARHRAQLPFQRGVLALARGDAEEGERLLKKALSADDSHHLARGTLGLSEFNRGETSGLDKVRASAKALGPSSDMQINLMRALEGARLWGDLETALDEFEGARGITGFTEYTRGRLLAGQERYEEAAATFLRVAELDPLNEAAVTNAARAERRSGDEAKALGTLRKAHGRLATPEIQAAHPGAGRRVAKELAWNLATTPDLSLIRSDEAKAEALALAKELLGFAPQNPELMDLTAAAEAASGNFDQAILHLQFALKTLGETSGEDPAPGIKRYVQDIEQRLEAYEAGVRWTRP